MQERSTTQDNQGAGDSFFLQCAAQLLRQHQTVLMATVNSAGQPEVSYSPHVIVDGVLYVFLSDLAAHTANLKAHPHASLLFIESEEKSTNLHARVRATFSATTAKVSRSEPLFKLVLEQMHERFGQIMAVLEGLPDFHLFAMTPQSVTVVAGFARARTLPCAAFPSNG